MALPTSPTWDLADFNVSTIGSLLTLGAGDVTISPGTSPYFSYTPDFRTLIAHSSDGVPAQVDLITGIPNRFTVEFVARFPFVPHNVGDLENVRVGLTIADDAGRGISIYFASTGLAISRVDDFGSVTALPDTADITAEFATTFNTIRVAVDSGLGRAYVYIGDGDTDNPSFRYIIPVEATPDSVIDTFAFFVRGTAAEPVQLELQRLQLAGDLLIPNFPPIADAGPDRIAPLGQAVRFDGRSSYDIEGAPLRYDWLLTDAPFGSVYAADISTGSSVDDGDADGFTNLLSFAATTLPAWVAPGDTIRIAGVRSVILTVDNPGGTLTVTTDTIPDSLGDTPFRLFRQSLVIGSTTDTPYAVPDVQGIYRFALTVNDGEIDSEESEVLANIVGARTPFGIEPDVSSIWKALGDEWPTIENRGVFEEGWRAATQILGGKLLEAWQYHYNFSIRDIQRTFQRKWIPYRTLITETDYETATIGMRYGALLGTHEFELSDPAVTGLTLVLEYPTGVTPTSVAEVTVTFTGDTLATVLADCTTALVGTGITPYAFVHRQDSAAFFYDGSDGWSVDDGDGNSTTAAFQFTPLTLPTWAAAGDTLVVGGDRFTLVTTNDAGGSLTATPELSDRLGASAVIIGTEIIEPTPATFVGITGNDLELIVDGVPTTVTFTATTAAVLVTEINVAVAATVASLTALGHLQLTSTAGGPVSTLEIGAATSAAVASILGLTIGATATGTGEAFRIWRKSRFGLKSTTLGFRVLSTSTAATLLGITTDQYNYLEGINGARITDRTYFAGDGVSLSEMGVVRDDLLVLNNGQSFRVDRILSGTQDPLPNQRFLLVDELPFDATPGWELPSVVRSTAVDYEFDGTYPGDLLKFEAYDEVTDVASALKGYVVAQKSMTVVGHLDELYGIHALLSTYELRLLGVKRRKALPLPDDVTSIPQLQDLIPVSASPTLWKEHVDYLLEPFYREIDEAPIPMLQFRDSVFIDPDIEPPDIFWAEVTMFSNEGNVENLFGRLAGFLRDDASLFDRDFNYTAGVAGLLSSLQRGPRVHTMRVGAQILFGQSFAEVDGLITEVRNDFSPTRGRLIVQDADGNDPTRSEIFRTYYYTKDPLDLTPTSGLDENPNTELPWAAGDSIAQFSPIGAGVRIVDIYNDPDAWIPFIRGGLITEVEKFHSFLVEFNVDLVSLANLSLLFQFISKVKPTYTHPFIAGVKDLEEDIDVLDEINDVIVQTMYDVPCTAGPAWMYDDYRGGVYTGGLPPTPGFTPDPPLWTDFDDAGVYYDAIIDCPLDLIEFCLTNVFADSLATFTSGEDISAATYPGDFGGLTLQLIVDGVTHNVVFSGGIVDEAAVASEINTAVGGTAVASIVGGQLVLVSNGTAGTQNFLGTTDGTSAGGATLTFTAASLPAWVSVGDELYFEGVLVHIATLNNPGGSLTVTPDVLPAATSQTFRVWEPTTSLVIGAGTTASLLTVLGFYSGQEALGNAIEFDGALIADADVVDEGGVVGPTAGSTFTPTYDMNLPAGSYTTCVFIKSTGVVLP